jgi:hypothetical protein
MTDYKGIIPLVIDPAKKKGMRFDISDFPDGEIECLNNDVVIFRGTTGKFINGLFECTECSFTRKPMRNRLNTGKL